MIDLLYNFISKEYILFLYSSTTINAEHAVPDTVPNAVYKFFSTQPPPCIAVKLRV